MAIASVSQLFDDRPVFPTLVDLVSRPVLTIARASASPRTIEGTPGIIDGDTLDVRGIRIRLYGIDAPERDQMCRRADGRAWPCGSASTAALRRLAAGRHLACEVKDRDTYGRLVSICRAGRTDVNAAMVRAGLALAYRHYSHRYAGDEADARRRKAGMWAGTFEAPWDWRHRS